MFNELFLFKVNDVTGFEIMSTCLRWRRGRVSNNVEIFTLFAFIGVHESRIIFRTIGVSVWY